MSEQAYTAKSCPECGGRIKQSVSFVNPNQIEFVCSKCGLVVGSEDIRRSPIWLPFHSPVFWLGFKKDLGQTLSTRNAKRILAKHSKSLYDKRVAWWRAKKVNSIFTKSKYLDVERMLLEAGKKIMEEFGLNVVEKADDPTDMAIVIANDFGRSLSRVAKGIEKMVIEGKMKRPGINPRGRAIAQATLFYILYKHNSKMVDRYKDRWRFCIEDLTLVKRALDSAY